MTSPNDKTATTPASGDARRPLAAGKDSTAFDLWLKQGLHRLFDDIANEPIPDELLRLIEQGKSK
jgi:hypothetical protein